MAPDQGLAIDTTVGLTNNKNAMERKSYSAKGVDLKEYEDWGIDISLLIYSLNRTPTERVEDNNQLLRLVDELAKSRAKRQSADTGN